MARGRVVLVLLAMAACARHREFIGLVPTDGAVGSDAGRPAVEVGHDSEPAPVAPAPVCPSVEPAAPQVPAPAWNCDGRPRCWRDEQVDPALLAGAVPDPDPLRRPDLVYPPAGSLHPINLPTITLQWRRGSPAQTAFRIRIAGDSPGEPPFELFVRYVRPTGPTLPQELDASYQVPGPVWRYIAERSAGGAVAITVSAYDPTANQIAESPVKTIRFSPAALEGGLHYLATEPPSAGIQQHVFGAASSRPLVQPLTARNPADCGGCHAFSRDGTTLAFSATYAGNLTVARTNDLEHPTMRPPSSGPDVANAVAPAVSPNGRYILARDGTVGDLTVYEASSGQVVDRLTRDRSGGRIDFPEWSPDGREIVATRAQAPGQPARPYSASDGHLVVLGFSQGRLAAPELLVHEPAEVHAHPSWSPDGKWILFVSTAVGSGESYRNPRTRLRLVRRDPVGPVIDLNNATPGGVGTGSTFPKFAPSAQRGCQLMFFTFHSRMDYGVLRRNSVAAEGGYPQLWLSAVDLTRLDGDPSSPPLWLPFQDINQKNLLSTWSAAIPCAGNDVCGAGASCRSGRCLADP
jgi:hypothetical protein